MSSTARAEDRQALDDYPTPRWCVHRLLERYPLPAGLWLEPCAGSGSIIRAVSEVRSDVRWHANELNAAYATALCSFDSVHTASHLDARQVTPSAPIFVIITNPPFSCALEILERMLDSGARVIFLQRLNWAAGPRRARFRRLFPSVYVLPDRPSFIDTYEAERPDVLKPGTDSIEYAWFCFDGRGQFRVLGDTPDTVRRAEIEEGRRLGTRPKRLAKPKRARVAA
jgi:hypothetical protein